MPLSEDRLSRLLEGVTRPARYVGGEVNSVCKPWGSVDFHLALAFPDIYDIAMSHLGLHILYGLVNSRPDSLAERVFAPWFDCRDRLVEEGVGLFSLESHRGLREFDAVGFSLQYEVSFATVLSMLDLSGIPRRRDERRGGGWPLLVAGGPCTFNPEPLADAFDLFFVGDGEEALPAFIDLWKGRRAEGASAVVAAAARGIEGIYAPGLYERAGDVPGSCDERGGGRSLERAGGREATPALRGPAGDEGALAGEASSAGRGAADGAEGAPTAGALLRPAAEGVPAVVTPACVGDLDAGFYPTAPVVPHVESVHERVGLEIMRGCARGCRFCQAGMTRRPVRVRSVGRLLELAEESYRRTGYDEISLLSLSAGDYPWLAELTRKLSHRFAPLRVGLAFPSLRADRALEVIPAAMTRVRKSAMTVAVEAGTERLRRVINKNISEEDLLSGLREAFREGWKKVKLYFMAGLPTETEADVEAAADLILRVVEEGRKVRGSASANVSVSPFVPKPGTPLQWEPMARREWLEYARETLHARLKGNPARLSFHNIDRSILEGALARGGREAGRAVEVAADAGAYLDAWREGFDFERWREAFAAAGLEIEEYACRRLGAGEGLPWGHISPGVPDEFLRGEREKALGAAPEGR